MKGEGDGLEDSKSQAVTINSVEESHENNNSGIPVEASNDNTTMAPKPAIIESNNGMDSENLVAASHEAANYRKDLPAEYGAASDDEDSIVSYSDASEVEWPGEETENDFLPGEGIRPRPRPRRSKKSKRKDQKENKPEEGPPPFPRDSSSSFQTRERPSSMVMPSSKHPNQQYVKLLNFQALYRAEQDRCPRYSKELEKVSQQWDACKTTLQRLLDEVNHANHLFHVSDDSFHQYSHVMYAIQKDIFLDDEGNRVTSSARQQILLKNRGKEPDSSTGKDTSSKAGSSEGYLDPLFNSFSVLTGTMMTTVMDRESDDGKQAAAVEFQEFSEELITQAEAMKDLGESVLEEMNGSEMDIQNAFRVLEQLAAKVKSSRSSAAKVLEDDIKLKKTDKNFPKEMEYGGNDANVGDWWLWETLYRAAVKHQQITWSANCERVQGLEEFLNSFQEKHQKKLEKAVLAVMPEQREMFLVGAEAFESALKKTNALSSELEGKAGLNHESIAEEFEKGVQKRSTALMQEKTHHKSSILNKSRSKYNSAIRQAENLSASSSGDLNSKPLPAFVSPVLSKLVLKAQVVERWEKQSGWDTTIAVFTVDRYLHLFDCADLDIKTMPQTAFYSMFPTKASSRSGVHFQGGGRRKASRETEYKIPHPTMTFNVVTCDVKTYGYSKRSFEIKQVVDPIANSSDLPQANLRFKDTQDAIDWYALLQDIPDLRKLQSAETMPEQQPQEEELDQKLVEEEAARANDLYDDVEAEHGGSDHIEDDHFEDASEYLDDDLEDLEGGEYQETAVEANDIPDGKKAVRFETPH